MGTFLSFFLFLSKLSAVFFACCFDLLLVRVTSKSDTHKAYREREVLEERKREREIGRKRGLLAV
jgi:hypothetical protein